MNRPRKILFIGTKGIPARYGGFETVVEQVSMSLARKGYYCIVFSTFQKVKLKLKNLKTVKIPQIGIPSIDRLLRELYPLIYIFKNKNLIFHIYGPYIFMPILKLFRKKTIISTDGLEWKRYSYSPLISAFVYIGYKLGVKYALSVTTDSKFTQKWFYRNWDRKTFYIPYGPRSNKIILKNETEILKKYDLEENNYFLFVGRLVPEKGVHILIKAFTQVDTSRKLIILGEDPKVGSPYKTKLKKFADNNKILFLGAIYGEDYKKICRECYVNIRPSINNSEGIGPATIEALGFGNCIIASNVPQNIEAIGKAGIFYKRKDISDLINKIELLDKNENLVKKYRKKASERVKIFSWRRIINRIENIYRKL